MQYLEENYKDIFLKKIYDRISSAITKSCPGPRINISQGCCCCTIPRYNQTRVHSSNQPTLSFCKILNTSSRHLDGCRDAIPFPSPTQTPHKLPSFSHTWKRGETWALSGPTAPLPILPSVYCMDLLKTICPTER